MSGEDRVGALAARLDQGGAKVEATLRALPPDRWASIVYRCPTPWTVRDVIAHLLSAECALLLLAQDVASRGSGSPDGFDYHGFNWEEQEKFQSHSPDDLLLQLGRARLETIEWVRSFQPSVLENRGRHRGLGLTTLETMLNAMQGHQLLHLHNIAKLR